MTLRRLLLTLGMASMLAACAEPPSVRERLGTTSPADDGTLRLAEATRQGGDLGAAASLYQQVLKRHPDSEPALQGLASTQMAAGEHESARLTYTELTRRFPQSPEGPLGLARIAVMKRNLGEAETQYGKARELSQATDTRALFGLGVTRDLQGRHAEAQAMYRDALAIQPDNTVVRSNLGLSLALSGDPRQAVNVLLDIATAPSAPPQARQNLALAYGLLGNQEAAEAVMSNDLQRPAIQNNLRFYAHLRAHGFDHPATDGGAMP